ncbi:glycosyltransferase [Novosphingobium humi]|uniref:glycosyltransferase n=1 Tax=Novosphingobium humi TaxID=2282397 RepID=UPI0025B05970|nr:glycosyltransferase [Novosphingobium humi]WJS99227.1 glycosyltransferase [Novosphingobium humi]
MIRVGFVFARTDTGWMGGITYMRNLIAAIQAIPNRKIEPVLIVPSQMPDKNLSDFKGLEIIRTAALDRKSPAWLLGKLSEKYLFKRNLALEAVLRQNRIAILSHHARIGSKSKFPNLLWIPDFQQKRRPDFFEPAEIARRDADNERCVAEAHWVVLSSHDALNDLKTYVPAGADKSSVLRFVSGIQSTSRGELGLAELEAKYGFSGPYFHLPNQYWAHKNHAAAIRAVALLKQQGLKVTVLSTGAPTDYRHPKFFESIEKLIQELDVADCYKVLGLIDYADMGPLMGHSVALINPSYFEGWSTTVEEAKAMGKAIILSNIPVHIEQNPARGVYFDPDQPEELAQAMREVLAAYDPAQEEALVAQAKIDNQAKFVEFGEVYQQIILESLGKQA